ncbi:MAG: ribosome small subunit-dependent GTPase A [Candidatus Hydrogenedentes bacterium]|nr:ribosome small subunit-dependent GTPase A [Candidatus Hydrogenedentota bacterium]
MKPRRGKDQRKQLSQRDWHALEDDPFQARGSKPYAEGKARALASTLPLMDWSLTPPNGVVVSHVGAWAFVYIEGQEFQCVIDERMGDDVATLVAPGDLVRVEFENDQWIVRAVAPRRSKLSRLALRHARVSEQVIAANIDLLVVIASVVQPRFKPGLVDRYLITAEVGGVQPMLCVNKMDLVETEPEEISAYRSLALPVVATSCRTGAGLDELRRQLEGKISVLAGHSGVGKSTIIRSLCPELEIPVAEISASTQKGRHTTTRGYLHVLPGDIRIIDTPGTRELGLTGISREEVKLYFPEIVARATECRFRDCTHTHEPNCAVRAAVESSQIPKLRYDSYLRIRESL